MLQIGGVGAMTHERPSMKKDEPPGLFTTSGRIQRNQGLAGTFISGVVEEQVCLHTHSEKDTDMHTNRITQGSSSVQQPTATSQGFTEVSG